MIVNFQKPIDFINDCEWTGDYKELEKAIKLRGIFKIRGITYCEPCKKQFKNERGYNMHRIRIHDGRLR